MKQIQMLQAWFFAMLLMVAGLARAVLPTEATAAFTSLSADITSMLALIWPVVVIGTVGFVLIRLFRKGVNKAV